VDTKGFVLQHGWYEQKVVGFMASILERERLWHLLDPMGRA
jgi:hypothetical protein